MLEIIILPPGCWCKKQQKQKIKNAIKKHAAKPKTKGNAQRSKTVIAWGQLPRNRWGAHLCNPFSIHPWNVTGETKRRRQRRGAERKRERRGKGRGRREERKRERAGRGEGEAEQGSGEARGERKGDEDEEGENGERRVEEDSDRERQRHTDIEPYTER